MSDVEKERYLFNPDVLKRLSDEKYVSKYSLNISANNPGVNLKIRPLKTSDYESGFLEVLKQLTVVGEITEKTFLERFRAMESCPNTYYVVVIEDIEKNKVIGTSMLVLEQKFIHGCALKGNIEEVVVSDEYRGRGLGKLLIATLVLLAEELNCYKTTLSCKDEKISFYSSLGFKLEPGNGNFMVCRLKQ